MGSCMSNDATAERAERNNEKLPTKSKKDSAAEKAFQIDQDTLSDFLKSKDNLDHVWNQMDKDNNGFLDEKEFKMLLQVALTYFCELRDPDNPRPDDETMGPVVDQLSTELKPYIDENNDGQITREEFERFGAYLCQEHQKLQNELSPKANPAAEGGESGEPVQNQE